MRASGSERCGQKPHRRQRRGSICQVPRPALLQRTPHVSGRLDGASRRSDGLPRIAGRRLHDDAGPWCRATGRTRRRDARALAQAPGRLLGRMRLPPGSLEALGRSGAGPHRVSPRSRATRPAWHGSTENPSDRHQPDRHHRTSHDPLGNDRGGTAELKGNIVGARVLGVAEGPANERSMCRSADRSRLGAQRTPAPHPGGSCHGRNL
jgi:hypothetical protein